MAGPVPALRRGCARAGRERRGQGRSGAAGRAQEPAGGGGVGGTRAGSRGHRRRKGQPGGRGPCAAGPRFQHAARTDTAPPRRLPDVKLSVLSWGRGDNLLETDVISSEEAQKEMSCSLKITGATGKKQRRSTEQGNGFQVIQTCC
ncbi:small membrane A-kinase anchor protein isoform X2 [Agelaius tricolor]|uniref:small membrane A-kinase anchor protein isoform X2 n=1 Tax=Agelaius tricolor TaxID=9191 RepID=UPI0039F1F038